MANELMETFQERAPLPVCLIAAHDPWFIQLLRIYTEESGFRVVLAYQGQDVFPLVQQERPAAILLQADLPGQIKGLDVLQAIQEDPLTCHTPVLVFSWHGQGTTGAKVEGTATHLQEPITYEAFVTALKKAGVNCLGNLQPLEPTPAEKNTPAEENNRPADPPARQKTKSKKKSR